MDRKSNLMYEIWTEQFKNTLRPHINDAPSVEELELFLQEEADMAWDTLSSYKFLEDPSDAANTVLDSIRSLS